MHHSYWASKLWLSLVICGFKWKKNWQLSQIIIKGISQKRFLVMANTFSHDTVLVGILCCCWKFCLVFQPLSICTSSFISDHWTLILKTYIFCEKIFYNTSFSYHLTTEKGNICSMWVLRKVYVNIHITFSE